ncbi:MAG: hypothetical protein RLZZ254_1135 [Actinomycetota bacterium]|jgi:Leucine-rich repeat (LRR) protein
MNINLNSFTRRFVRLLLATGVAASSAVTFGLKPVQAEVQIRIGSANLERYLIQQGFDTGVVDGVIPFSNAQRIKRLDLVNLDINSLEGIEQFKNLEYLDLTGNDELGSTWANSNLYLSDDFQNLKTLKMAGTKLVDFVIYATKLETVDFSNNRNIERIEILGSRIKNLNVNGATKLRYLRVNGGSLTSVDLSTQWELDSLTITSNKLASINLATLSKLTYLELTNNQLTSIDLSKNTSLQEAYIQGNKLTSLDTSNNAALEHLKASSNDLTTIDLSKNLRLLTTNLADNKLKSVKLPSSSYLASLNVAGNRLAKLDLSNQPELSSLEVSANRLRTLDLRNQAYLMGLNIGFNPMSKLMLPPDLSRLSYLDLSSTKIKRLDLRGANLATGTTDRFDFWEDSLYANRGLGGQGLWSHDTKITLVVDNPPLVRTDAGHSIDDHVKLVRK